MNITEKYCLKWNEFSLYICDSFRELRDDSNFCDVTLACDDGEQIKANKVVLSSCSPVLKNLLKSNPHPHPLLVLRGYRSQYLNQLIDFMYFGEVDVAQRDFDEFLRGAKDLQVQGLSEEKPHTPKNKPPIKCEKPKLVNDSLPVPQVKTERPSSPKKILEVVKTKVSLNPTMVDEIPSKQSVPPQLQRYKNVTVTSIENNETDIKCTKVEKQENEVDEEEDEPSVFVSDSEDTEMASETDYQESIDNSMIEDSMPEKTIPKETVSMENDKANHKPIQISTARKNEPVNIKHNTDSQKSTVQPVTFTAIPTYTEIPQVEIFVPASITPQVTTVNQPDPLRPKVNKFSGPKLKLKEEDPILKMFSTRCAGGWTCTTCGQFQQQKDAMKGHIQTNHMNGFGHVCDNCGKSFRTRGRLLSHIDQNHAS